MSEKRKNKKLLGIILVVVIVIVLAIWLALVRWEGEKPTVTIDLPSDYIGQSHDLNISIFDKKSGLRKAWVGLLKDGKEIVLRQAEFPASGLFRKGSVFEDSLAIKVEPKKLGISDGKAILRIAVRDYSWRGWWSGNQTYFEKQIMIDTRSPEIEVLTDAHNVTQGGAGLIIYRTSEACPQTGVHVGDNFFPGYSGISKDARVFATFFALRHDQGPGTKLSISATDQAGNGSQAGFYHHIRRKTFRKDSIAISDAFLNRKLPEFPSVLAQNAGNSPVDKFLAINRDLRKADYHKILELVQKTDNHILWQGRFVRLPKSATRARFADHRTYTYKGKEIDRQIHFGIDLASIAQSPVPAANSGIVVFADDLGIYGKTVFIDHGFNLFSAYSHLSHIAVLVGDRLTKGQKIGRTGSSGLAGGDHLHFGMMIFNTFVNPVEWWDSKWIINNVTSKLESVEGRLKQE